MGKLIRRKRIKSNLVSSGTMRRRRMVFSAISNRNGLRTLPAHPSGNNQACQGEGGEQRGENADAERDGKAADRAGADEEQHGGGDERGDVGIENGRQRAREASVDRLYGG